MIVRHRFVFTEAEVETATTAAAAIASGHNAAYNDTCLFTTIGLIRFIFSNNLPNFLQTLQAGDVTTKYALTFSSPNCSAMYRPIEP